MTSQIASVCPPSPEVADNSVVSTRTREAALVVSVVAVLAVLVVFLVVLMQPSKRPHAEVLPAALEQQVAPARSSVAPVTTSPGISQRFQPSQAWVAQISRRTGISSTAITAYASATLRIAREQPSCHLGWTTLAGVGAIESGHGTTGGRQLLPSGLSDRQITGPLLNGAGGYAAISNGQGGWSSALGPMQFIQSSWDRWGSDANGDGVKDVNNIFDAALAAGRYLCADGRDLATAHGWTAAIYSYNHDVAYVQNVYNAANAAAR